jgi:hypothetical protein
VSVKRRQQVLAVAVAVALWGCRQQPEPSAVPLEALGPRPLPELSVPAAQDAPGDADPTAARERLFEVASAPVFGGSVPQGALTLRLEGERALLDGVALSPSLLEAKVAGRKVVLAPDGDTFLAQAAPWLAALDDAGAEVFAAHPDGQVAFPLLLRDEPSFRGWLDAPDGGGKVRVIHRADGFELQTAVGKLPGADPNGPSVPLRGGHWDLARLRTALGALKDRFPQATESCVVPSFGMELATTARALTAYWSGPDRPTFRKVCLVYPRPGP